MDRSGLVSIELLQVLKICNYSWRSKFSLACRGSCFFASLLFLCRRQERPWVSSLDGMNRVGCLVAAVLSLDASVKSCWGNLSVYFSSRCSKISFLLVLASAGIWMNGVVATVGQSCSSRRNAFPWSRRLARYCSEAHAVVEREKQQRSAEQTRRTQVTDSVPRAVIKRWGLSKRLHRGSLEFMPRQATQNVRVGSYQESPGIQLQKKYQGVMVPGGSVFPSRRPVFGLDVFVL